LAKISKSSVQPFLHRKEKIIRALIEEG